MILTYPDERLKTVCSPVDWADTDLPADRAALHDALDGFRRAHGFGRAIAAPQIGVAKRLVAVNLGATPFTLHNPGITWRSEEMHELWDDCLSLPDVVVRVRRHVSVSLRYEDETGREWRWNKLSPEMSELMQHEIDHLDGILMTEHAVGPGAVRPIADRESLIDGQRSGHRLSLDAIAEAAHGIDPVFTSTPQYACEPLSEVLGCHLTLKVETLNPIRSFKGRGADFFLGRARARGDDRPLVCASAGNWGQALGYACRSRGLPLVVYAAESANALKLERMRALGVDLRIAGRDFDGAKAEAKRFAEAEGAWMVEDGLEAEISEGAGSIAVELLSGNLALDAVVVSLGNGALLNGMARWIKAASPATEVIGVCASGADATEKSWRTGQLVERDSIATIADGIGVRVPIQETLDDMAGQIDDILLTEEESLLEAMRLLFDTAGLVVEPAGAAGVAAILEHRERFAGRSVATVICGSNLTQEQMQRWLLR